MKPLEILFGLIVLVVAGVLGWNVVGAIALEDTDDSYVGLVREGGHAGSRINAAGVQLVREWIETRTEPSVHFSRILRHQFWYNAVTEGYDLYIWMEPREYSPTLREYAIYQSDDYVFLRVEPWGRNRVLVADFTAAELEEALDPYIEKH